MAKQKTVASAEEQGFLAALDPTPLGSDLRRALNEATREAATAAELVALPVQNPHACGIDFGDLTHWVCVGATPDGSQRVREFPAHT